MEELNTPAPMSADELARRRRAAARWGWALGLLVIGVYVGGLFIPR